MDFVIRWPASPREAEPPSFVCARVCKSRHEPGSLLAVVTLGLGARDILLSAKSATVVSRLAITMTPAASVSFFNCEFGEFLYAPIGSERNGMTLSLLSALARLNIDPWEEASRLAQLPKSTATQRLASLIARLPQGAWAEADCCTIADRLIELLPRPSRSDSSSTEDAQSRRINPSAAPIVIAVALGLAALFLVATREPSSRGDASDTPAYAGSAKGG
jgi:hypothetical protein